MIDKRTKFYNMQQASIKTIYKKNRGFGLICVIVKTTELALPDLREGLDYSQIIEKQTNYSNMEQPSIQTIYRKTEASA